MGRKVNEFSSGALIEIARKSAKNGELGIDTFKEVNGVDFSFMELCLSLYKRKVCKKRILTSNEFTRIKQGLRKNEIVEIFDEVKERHEELLFQQRDEVY